MKRFAFALVCLLGLAGCNLLSIQTPTPFPTLSIPSPQATATAVPPTVTPSATLPSPSATSTLSVPTALSSNTALPSATTQPGVPSGPYAVILVLPGDVLNIRSGAGAGNPVVGTFQPTFNGVMRTGPSARVGDALWVEVQRPDGGKGWVNSNFLMEYVSPSVFCGDPKVTSLINNLKSALNGSDGQKFSSLVSPLHGLDLRFYRYGTLANYSREEAQWVFGSDYSVNWGPEPGSGFDKVGSFREVPLPRLLEVLNAQYSLHCNDTLDLATFSLTPWPPEYANVNFYAIYKPGSPGVELDWRAWLAGVEYVNGQPTLFALIHFQWEP